MKYLYNSPRHPCPRRGKARKTALNKGVQSRARVCFSPHIRSPLAGVRSFTPGLFYSNTAPHLVDDASADCV